LLLLLFVATITTRGTKSSLDASIEGKKKQRGLKKKGWMATMRKQGKNFGRGKRTRRGEKMSWVRDANKKKNKNRAECEYGWDGMD
jgi:hypothetical protein